MSAAPVFDDLAEPDLVAIACSDDPPATVAFGLLVERYYQQMLGFLEFLAAERDGIAHDLTQETFVAAFKNRRRLRDPQAFRPWLHEIARNIWRMERRRSVRHRLASLTYQQPEITAYPLFDLILATIQELPVTSQEALYLRHVGRFSDAEIAAILGISRAAAQKRVYRAEAEFRRRYAALAEHAGEIEHDAEIVPI